MRLTIPLNTIVVQVKKKCSLECKQSLLQPIELIQLEWNKLGESNNNFGQIQIL